MSRAITRQELFDIISTAMHEPDATPPTGDEFADVVADRILDKIRQLDPCYAKAGDLGCPIFVLLGTGNPPIPRCSPEHDE